MRTKTLVKGAIVIIDCTPFRQFYESRYGWNLGKTKSQDESKFSKGKKEKVQKTREGKEELDQLLKDQFMAGKLMAKIKSRPGQVGRVDGYILEGPELAFYLKKIQTKKAKKK